MCSIPGLPTPGSEVPVLITRVNLNLDRNPDCGFVELWVNMDDGRKHIYEQMKQDIQIPKRKFYGSEGKPGDLCLACISDIWHRGRIISIQSETYSIFLIDKGQPHITTSEALAWGQSDSFLLPPEIESCILSNVFSRETNWPQSPTKFLKSLPGKKFKGLVQHVLMPDRIILLDIPTVSKHLCKCGVTKKIAKDEFKCLVLKCLNLAKEDASEICPKTQDQNLNVSYQHERHDQYFYPELQTDTFETVNVTEVANPQNIFCSLLIFSKAVKTLSEQIHKHYEKTSDFGEVKPQTCGDPCAARGLNRRWHRSLLKQNMTSDGSVEVLHVDEGKTELIPVEDIKPLHGKFLRMPVVTYRCSLSGVKNNGTDWTPFQNNYLKSLLLNQTVVARFDHYSLSQDVYHVTFISADDTCLNNCFIEKASIISSTYTQQESNVQNELVPSSSHSLLGDQHWVDAQNKVKVNIDGLPEENLQRTNNLAVNGTNDYEATPEAEDVLIKSGLELQEPLIQSNGHPSAGLHSDVLNAHDDSVLTVGSSVNVNISCIESLQKFWCQMTKNAEDLRLLMQGLQKHYTSTHPRPLVESTCVARNPNNGMWCRAMIIANHHSPVVDVRFIDYGQTQTVPLRDVRPIDPAYLQLNAQAFQCCLFNLKNPTNPTAVTWRDSALPEFQKFLDLGAASNTELKCTVKAVMSDEDGLPINVVDIETPSDSACKLLAQRCAQTEEVCGQIPQHVPPDVCTYSTHNIEVGGKEKVLVTFPENVHHFYCQLERNSQIFEKVMENVHQLIGQPKRIDHTLGLNSICLARYCDNQWYRGQIVEMSPKLKVHFVDYGQTLAVSESDTCPFPTEASIARSVPVQAIPLGLLDIPEEVPQEVNQWFADHAINHSFTISVVAKGDSGKLIVELFEGSLNINVIVREKILKMTQQKTTDLVKQTDQQLSNGSNGASVPNGDCSTRESADVSVITKMAEQKEVLSSNEMCSTNELKVSSYSITNLSAPEIQHEKTLDEGRKLTLDVIFEEKESLLAETFIKEGNTDFEITQLSPNPCHKENVKICMYKKPNISLNKTEEVNACCIVGPHYFWCQYTNCEDLKIVLRLAQQVGQTQQDITSLKTLDPGNPCLVLSSSDNQWYRAQVIQRTDDRLHVVFIDYGNKCDVDINNVRPLPESLLEKPPQAFLCSLNGYDESKGSWDDEANDEFYSLLVDKPLKVTVYHVIDHSESAVPQYAVKIESEDVIVNNAMLKYWKPFAKEDVIREDPQTENLLQDESNMTHVDGNMNTCMYKEPKISMNKTEIVYASCIAAPSFFWCQYANTEELNEISRLAQGEGQTQQDKTFPQTLGPGTPCLALFSSDKQWYRAQVIHRVEDTCHVVFIDYGNESDVDIKDVRPLPKGLLEKAPQAFLCSLYEFDESKGFWDDEANDEIYSLLVDKPLRVTVFNICDHSELAVPQYAVKIECDRMTVNTEMKKYWRAVAKELVLTNSPQTEMTPNDSKTESNVTHISVSRGNCQYKEPNCSDKETERVYASSISQPHFFWCQYANTEELNEISRLAQEEGQAQQEKMFPETLGPGSPCLALFSSDKRWYRAQVIHRVDDTFHVVFIDYGNESDVEIKDVRPLPENLLEKSPQAFLCFLNGFDESRGFWDDEVYDDFYNLLVDKPLKVSVFNKKDHSELAVPQYAVEVECDKIMINAEMQKYWKPVAKERVFIESPQIKSSHQKSQTESAMSHLSVSNGNVNTCMYKEPKISMNKTEIVYTSCIAGPNFFWCQYTNTEELNKISRLAQEEGQAQQEETFPETLGPGTPCLALFSSDKQWYRAQVIHRAEDTFHVVFIDYGNESDVDIKDVRPLPKSLLEKAPQAFLCSLYEFDESKGFWDDEAYDHFHNLLVDKPLKLTVLGMKDHSEIAFPEYAVQIECEGVVVNTVMEKYWRGLDTAQGLAERVG